MPIVVVQGETDAFGRPEDVAAVLSGRGNASVYAVAGDHALKKDVHVVAAAAMSWLDDLFVPPVGVRRRGSRTLTSSGSGAELERFEPIAAGRSADPGDAGRRGDQEVAVGVEAEEPAGGVGLQAVVAAAQAAEVVAVGRPTLGVRDDVVQIGPAGPAAAAGMAAAPVAGGQQPPLGAVGR